MEYEVTTSVDEPLVLDNLKIDTQVDRQTLLLLQSVADLCGRSVGEVVSKWLEETARQKANSLMPLRDAGSGKHLRTSDPAASYRTRT